MAENVFFVAVLFVSVIISAFSQILLKKSALKTYESKIKEYLNILVLSGYFLFFIAIFLDMVGLKKVPVSYIPVIESSSYFFVLIFSRIFLNEKLSKRKIIAISIILIGIFIYLY